MADLINIEKINGWADSAAEDSKKLEEIIQIMVQFSDGTFPKLDNVIKEVFAKILVLME
jgi:hypothetical protein